MNSFLPKPITSTQVFLQLHATLHSASTGRADTLTGRH